MTRTDKIIAHLKAKGAQYFGDACDKIITDKFTEHVFRNLDPSVRVREWNHGIVEIFFVHEICAGGNRDAFHKVPDMEWVLQMIDEELKPLPPIPEKQTA
jgi:hypothetical protein